MDLWLKPALVLWSDCDSAYFAVQCPFCESPEEHKHKLSNGNTQKSRHLRPETRERRFALCSAGYGLPYRVVFPWDDHPAAKDLSYEKNLMRDRWQTVGISQVPFQNNLFEDITGESHEHSPESVDDVSESVDGGSFPSLMLPSERHRSEPTDTEGNTALILAAISNSLPSMAFCLNSGADINACNYQGWSALMYAAFLGCTAAVVFLLENGAKGGLVDQYGRKALCLARETRKLEEQRVISKHYNLSATTVQRLERKRIRVLLSPYAPNGLSSSIQGLGVSLEGMNIDLNSLSGFFQSHHDQSTGTVTVLAPVYQIKTNKVDQKTACVLLRGGPFPPVLAISGWNGAPKSGRFLLNNKTWQKKVYKLGLAIGHTFKPDPWDMHWSDTAEKEGRVSAGHAEKQLLTFAALKHPQESRRKVGDMIILTDKPPCQDCLNFQREVEDATGLKFRIQVMSKTNETLEPATPIRFSKRKLKLTPDSSGLPYNRRSAAKVRGVEAYRNADEADDEEEELEDDIPIPSSATTMPTTRASSLPLSLSKTGRIFIDLTLDESDNDVSANNPTVGPTSRSMRRAMPVRSSTLQSTRLTRREATIYASGSAGTRTEAIHRTPVGIHTYFSQEESEESDDGSADSPTPPTSPSGSASQIMQSQDPRPDSRLGGAPQRVAQEIHTGDESPPPSRQSSFNTSSPLSPPPIGRPNYRPLLSPAIQAAMDEYTDTDTDPDPNLDEALLRTSTFSSAHRRANETEDSHGHEQALDR